MLYTGTEVDKTGPSGKSWLRKLDGLTGRVLWERSYPCQGAREPKKVDAGVFATPLVGSGDVSDRVIFTLSRCPGFTDGLMVALDKATGEEVWRKPLDNYAWSSPTACKDEQSHTFILQGDLLGTVPCSTGAPARSWTRPSSAASSRPLPPSSATWRCSPPEDSGSTACAEHPFTRKLD
ncbi:PQQ-binding-like beta-propeller repeat protein [Hyalangium rubrum]|uniref:Pyrrolo-quinoline quinone n=1 Tax=Hyalangium rubrum TaxID=3103134 RepID=A0ABU5GX19_9BACT|nr:PQQ-binding-like beta-propeller repeat protein [Hyalangium sp. s54d21]MDY7225741.1 hypothetical protein [Hyalangium sp. s54d21]